MDKALNYFSIVLIEDQEIDANYFKTALEQKIENVSIDIFEDGESAIHSLEILADEAIRPLPNLILLDLNLPLKSGFEVLEELRGDPRLMAIPVLIVSTSTSKRDVQKAYRMKANAFVQKPDDITGYGKIAEAVNTFWHDVALYPK